MKTTQFVILSLVLLIPGITYRFVPPGFDSSDSSYVKWKKEGKRWVVAEIAYPQA